MVLLTLLSPCSLHIIQLKGTETPLDVKTDPNTDIVLAQSRETQAASQLPQDVNNYGITVRKSVTAPLMLIALYSPHGTYDARFLANYSFINLADPITRSYGVGQVQIFGAGQYAMRLWVKPDQLAKLGVTVTDIVSAVQSQNTVNPAGRIGGEPVPPGQQFAYAVRAIKKTRARRQASTPAIPMPRRTSAPGSGTAATPPAT